MRKKRRLRLYKKDSEQKLRAYRRKIKEGKIPPSRQKRRMRADYTDFAQDARNDVANAKKLLHWQKNYY